MLARLFNIQEKVAFVASLIRQGVLGYVKLVFGFALPVAIGYFVYYATPYLLHVDTSQAERLAVMTGLLGLFIMGGDNFNGIVYKVRTYADLPGLGVQFCLVMLIPWIMGISFFRVINYYTLLDPNIKYLLATGFWFTVLMIGYLLTTVGATEISEAERTVRGAALVTDIGAMQICDAKRPKEDPGIEIGGCKVPYKDVVNGHIAVIGTTRSGKSLTIFYLLRDTLKRDIEDGQENGISGRALIFDYKGDVIPFLTRIVGINRSLIKDLHPQREGAYAWDIAKDVTDESRSDQVAAAFIPRPKEGADNNYWTNAGIAIVSGLMLSFKARCGKDWSVLDLVRALRLPKEKVADIIKGTETTRHLAYQFFGRDERFDDVG